MARHLLPGRSQQRSAPRIERRGGAEGGRQSVSRRARKPEKKGRGGQVNGVRVTVRLACVYAAFLGCAPAIGAEAFITDQTGDEVSADGNNVTSSIGSRT